MATQPKTQAKTVLPALILREQQQLLHSWLDRQRAGGATGAGQLDEATLSEQSRRFLDQLRIAAQSGRFADITSAEWAEMRALLEEVSSVRAAHGFSPSETATFVFSLKEPL